MWGRQDECNGDLSPTILILRLNVDVWAMQTLALGKGYRVLVENVPFDDEMRHQPCY